jgi:hypothetical protein
MEFAILTILVDAMKDLCLLKMDNFARWHAELVIGRWEEFVSQCARGE